MDSPLPVLNFTYSTTDKAVPAASVMQLQGPTILVLVGVAPVAAENGTLNFQGQQVAALIDTGAFTSCIDEKLAIALALTPIDKQKIGGAAGKQDHLIYLGMIAVPALNTHHKGRFVGVKMEGSQQVLLGRDFLRDCVLIYSGGTGSITLCR